LLGNSKEPKGRYVRRHFTSVYPSIRGHGDPFGYDAYVFGGTLSRCAEPMRDAGRRPFVASKVMETPSRVAHPHVTYGTGYKLSKEQFGILISDQSCRAVVAPLLRRWFAYEIIGFGQDAQVRSANGSVDPDQLHNSIQSDSRKQNEMYQTAMRLWR
jgi:hypothetical protein